MKKLITVILITIFTFSCASKEEKINAEIAYAKAMKLLKNKDYSQAAKEFDNIDDEYPFSKWAPKAQVMAIYANYKNEEFDLATSSINDFIRLNSASEFVPYLIYLKGIIYYNKIPKINRAQDDTRQASLTFRELIARFPDTAYAQDAKEKLPFIDEHLAGWEMSVGRYQINNQNYIGAIDHFNVVVNRYRLTKQVPEAYFRLFEIYSKLGITKEANAAKENLINNFSENYWSKLAAKK
jgi:outer membrane protein assembly factor BamD